MHSLFMNLLGLIFGAALIIMGLAIRNPDIAHSVSNVLMAAGALVTTISLISALRTGTSAAKKNVDSFITRP